MRLLVTKLGAVLRTMEYGSAPKGERGETEGVVKHLVSLGHDVTYFGAVRGELPCRVIEPDLNGVDRWSGQAQRDAWQRDLARVKSECGEERFDAYLQVSGATATYTVDGPTYSAVRDVDVKRVGPAKALAHHLGVPIILINNDPRTYPREVEMGLTWTDTAPIALLDNWAGETRQVIGGRKFLKVHCHSWSESWGEFATSEIGEKRRTSVICGHGHFTDSIGQAARELGWRTVLEGAFEELEDLHVYGSDWESFSLYEKWKSRFNAEVRGPVATQLYEESLCSPCVGYERNRSGKAYMIAAAGCVPLLYGDGSDVHTWDREGLVIPLGHPTRITKPGDLVRMARDPQFFDEWLPFMRERFVQNWSVLDACLDDLKSQLHIKDRAEWTRRYGGYIAI